MRERLASIWVRTMVATALVATALVASDPGGAASGSAEPEPAIAADPQLALAEQLLALANDESKPPAERAIKTARLAVDARRGDVEPELLPLLDQQARNLDTAERLLALSPAEDTEVADHLALGIEIAKVATEWQADTLGLDLASVDLPTAPSHALPSEAAIAFIEGQGGELSGSELEHLRAFDALPGDAPTALANVIDAFVVFLRATEAAYEGVDVDAALAVVEQLTAGEVPPDIEITGPGSVLDGLGIDLTPVFAARQMLLDTIVPLRDALLSPPVSQASAPPFLQIAPYFAIDLLSDTTYSQDLMLSIDALGNDTYLNNAGGGNGFRLQPAGAAFDLSGNDEYRSLRGDGINGGGSVGSGLLVDAIGSDTYLAGGTGTNGGGILGTGLLIDGLGTNSFSAGGLGTNGGGDVGAGMLIDVLNSGPSSAGSSGTNGGGLAGTGFLYSSGGKSFTAGSSATNGGGRFGAGLLFSGLGGSSYSAGDNGVNGGGGGLSDSTLANLIGGTGFLFDLDGADQYSASSEGTNGGGFVGAGALIDVSGNDSYSAGSRGTNGGGNAGIGLLVDMSGSDLYYAPGTIAGVNGGGAVGSGALIDILGNDSYTAGSSGANGGATLGVTGLLLDGQGHDVYSDSDGGSGTNKTVIPKRLVGAQIDSDSASPVPTSVPPLPPTSLPPLPPTSLPPLPPTTLPTVTTMPLPPTTLPPTSTTTSVPLPTTTLPTVTTTSIPLPPTTVPPPPDLFTGYASNDCDANPDNTVVNFQSGTAYAKLRTKVVGSETWVCFAVDGGTGTAHIGGKAIVDATDLPVDDDQAACHQDGVPPFPQHFEGTFGPNNTPVHFDAVLVDDGPGVPSQQAWLCVKVDTVGKHLIVPGGVVRFVPDDLEHTDPPTTTTTTTSSTTTTTAPRPPLGEPSRHCVDNGGDTVLNEPAGNGRVWVYTHESGSATSACVRYEAGTGTVVGGRLIVDPGGSQTYVDVQERDDFTTDPAYGPDGPCNVNVLNITSEPNLIVKLRDPALGSPAFVCVKVGSEARRIKITTPADQSFVTWDADSDSAVPSDNT